MKLPSLISAVFTFTTLTACGSENTADAPRSAPTGSYDTVRGANTLEFAQDGDTIHLKIGEEISVKLDLPEGITNTAITWQPIEGWYDGPIQEFRTYRSKEGKIYYTDLQIRGIEAGQKNLTLAPAQQRQPVHDERRTLTFIVK